MKICISGGAGSHVVRWFATNYPDYEIYNLDSLTNDTRESAINYMADALIEESAEITVYNPKVSRAQMLSDLNNLCTRNERYLKMANDTCKAGDKAHAIAVLTEWDEFKDYYYPNIFDQML